MTRYTNTFRPNTRLGLGLSNLSQSLFSGMSPNDMATGELRNAQTEKYMADAEQTRLQTRELKNAARLRRDPGSRTNIASAMTDVPVSDINFLEGTKGGMQGPINMNPGQMDHVNSVIGNLMAMDAMTGKTNLDQFQKAVGTGTENQRIADAFGGTITMEDLAEIQGAIAGKQSYSATGGSYKDSALKALTRQRNAAAGLYDARAGEVGAGSPSDIVKITPSDANLMFSMLSDLTSESDIGEMDETAQQAIINNAGIYFQSPESPHYKNHAGSVGAAFEDLLAVGTTNQTESLFGIDALWPDKTVPNIGAVQSPTFGGTEDAGVAAAFDEVLPEGGNEVDALPDPRTLENGTIIRDPATGQVLFTVQNGQYIAAPI